MKDAKWKVFLSKCSNTFSDVNSLLPKTGIYTIDSQFNQILSTFTIYNLYHSKDVNFLKTTLLDISQNINDEIVSFQKSLTNPPVEITKILLTKSSLFIEKLKLLPKLPTKDKEEHIQNTMPIVWQYILDVSENIATLIPQLFEEKENVSTLFKTFLNNSGVSAIDKLNNQVCKKVDDIYKLLPVSDDNVESIQKHLGDLISIFEAKKQYFGKYEISSIKQLKERYNLLISSIKKIISMLQNEEYRSAKKSLVKLSSKIYLGISSSEHKILTGKEFTAFLINKNNEDFNDLLSLLSLKLNDKSLSIVSNILTQSKNTDNIFLDLNDSDNFSPRIEIFRLELAARSKLLNLESIKRSQVEIISADILKSLISFIQDISNSSRSYQEVSFEIS